MLQYVVFVGAALNLWGCALYVRDMKRGTAKPNRVSWVLWSVAPLIATAAALSKGVGLAALPIFISGFGPLLVLVASFASASGYWQLTTFDYVCGAFSVLALVLWWITQEPAVALGFAIASDAFALLPTLLKSWRHPTTESGPAYITGVLSGLSGFAAVHAWVFSEVAFLVYLVIGNSSLLFAIYRNRLTH